MSTYSRGEHLQPEFMTRWAAAALGVMPAITEINIASNVYGGGYGAWYTLFEETSGGPWMVQIVRTDPTYSGNYVRYRITIDGTLMSTDTTFPHQPTGANHFIGLPFGVVDGGVYGADTYPPIFARDSFKVEFYNADSSSRSEYAYIGYSL